MTPNQSIADPYSPGSAGIQGTCVSVGSAPASHALIRGRKIYREALVLAVLALASSTRAAVALRLLIAPPKVPVCGIGPRAPSEKKSSPGHWHLPMVRGVCEPVPGRSLPAFREIVALRLCGFLFEFFPSSACAFRLRTSVSLAEVWYNSGRFKRRSGSGILEPFPSVATSLAGAFRWLSFLVLHILYRGLGGLHPQSSRFFLWRSRHNEAPLVLAAQGRFEGGLMIEGFLLFVVSIPRRGKLGRAAP